MFPGFDLDMPAQDIMVLTGSALSAAVSLVLRLVGKNADPAKSREHVHINTIAAEKAFQLMAIFTMAALAERSLPTL